DPESLIDLAPTFRPILVETTDCFQNSDDQSERKPLPSKLAVIENGPKRPCSNSENPENTIEDFPLGRFMRFLKHLKLKKLLTKITDPRDPKKTEHSIEIVLMWVL